MRDARLGGVALRVDDEQPTFWQRTEAGRWEPGTLAVLDGLIGPGMRFLDIGAWIGPLSLYAAAKGAKVLALEPDPVAAAQFRRNVAANPSLAPRITLVEAALSPGAGPVKLGARRKRGDSMSSVLLAEGADSWSAGAITPAEILDRLRRMEDRYTPLPHAEVAAAGGPRSTHDRGASPDRVRGRLFEARLRRAPQNLTGNRKLFGRHAEERLKGASRSTRDRCASFETAALRLPQDDHFGSFGSGSQDEERGSTSSVVGGPLVAKIDIEGGEYALLPHLPALIENLDAFLVSFHPRFLAEAGTVDPLTALRDALEPLAGWAASPVETGGEQLAGVVPDAVLARPDHETWLFRPPASAPLGRPGPSR